MLKAHFEKKGDTVHAFGQAKHALAHLADDLGDANDVILLTDLGLPDMSGFELITKVSILIHFIIPALNTYWAFTISYLHR